jgi:hypothetical protein
VRDGQQEVRDLLGAGFSEQEVGAWAAQRREELQGAGFSGEEVDAYFGKPPPDFDPLVQGFQRNLMTAKMQRAGAARADAQAVEKEAEGAEPTPAASLTDALDAGFQQSVTGLLSRGRAPAKVTPADAPMYMRIAGQVGTLAGDLPAMAAGALAGTAAGAPSGPGALVTGTAGAFAVPEVIRSSLMDAYEKGSFTSFGDFWDRASGILLNSAKGWMTGAATGGAAVAAGAMLPAAVSPWVKATTTTAAEIATMTMVGKALEGEIPSAQDFLDAALVLGGAKASLRVASKLRRIYSETGVSPDAVMQDAARDPTINQDLLADGDALPETYRSAMGEQASDGAAPLPGSASLALPPAPTAADMARAGRSESVPLSQARATQGRMEFDRFDAGDHPPALIEGYEDKPVAVRKEDGEYLIFDGHHRVASAIADGRDALDMHVIDARDYAPEFQGRRPAPERMTDDDLLRELGTGGDGAPPGGTPPTAPAGVPNPDAAREAVLSKISIGDRDRGKGLSWNQLYTMTVDEMNPIREAVKAAGDNLPAHKDPYTLTRLTRGTYGKADQMLNRGTFDFDTLETNGKGLREIVHPVIDDLDGLRAYAAASRAVELEGRGITSGIDLEAARTLANDPTARAKFEPVMRELVDYQERTLSYIKDAGILSDEAFAAMREANKDYVPFFRLMDEVAPGIGKGMVARNPVRRIQGSERDILDPIESIIKNTYLYTALAERNRVGRAFIDMADATGRPGDFYEKVPSPVSPITVGEPEMARFLKEHGIEVAPEDLLTIFRGKSIPLATDEIAVFRDGKREVYRLDPEVASAFKGLDSESANMIVSVLAAPARLLRAGATLSPDFITRNVVRDFMTAFVNSKGLFSPIDTAKGMVGAIAKDADFEAWTKAGGANAAMVGMDRRYLQENIRTLTQETGLADRAWNVVRHPIDTLRMLSELAENATRLGEFKKVMRQQEAEGVTGREAASEAAFASREVTLDFARIGSKMRAYNMITAFANAQIQGVDRAVRAFGDRPGNTMLKIAAGITLPSVLLWWANHDDPRYRELPDWQKDLFWIIPTDKWVDVGPEEGPAPDDGASYRMVDGRMQRNDGAIFRIPKPFELGIVFGSGVERSLDAYFDERPDAFKGFSDSVVSALTPSVTPTIAQPLVEQFSNRSTFTGQTLVPGSVEKLLPEYQYTPYTTELAKSLGKMVGAFPGMREAGIDQHGTFGSVARALTTPVLIENYLRSWTGGLGVYALHIADAGLREAGVLPDPPKPADTLADIPFVKAFAVRYPSASAKSIQDFHDDYAQNKRFFDTWMQMAKDGEIDDMSRVESAGGPMMMVQLDGIDQALREHSQIIRDVYKNPEMPPDEKRQFIDTLYYREIELSRAGLTAMNAAKEALGLK